MYAKPSGMDPRPSVVKRLGAIPFWRGEEKCQAALEGMYRKAMAKAAEALKREDSRPGKTA